MEKAIRVLVANRPRMMRELILATFADQPDIEIVGEVASDEDIPTTVERTLPHLVVVALEERGRRPRVCDVVLRQHPDIKIIGVDTKQNYSVFSWLSPVLFSPKSVRCSNSLIALHTDPPRPRLGRRCKD